MSISASQVKDLREKTGVGMMDCKKALVECGGDEEKAIKYLREKGLSKAAKKADRDTAEGYIGSYVHSNGKIGVMVELQCETDFVAKNDKFIELAKNIAMQIAASSPICLSAEELPQEKIDEEKEVFRQQALADGKPENIVDKIVEGRVQKYAKEVCLLEQSYIRDDKVVIKDLINEMITVLGENIQIGKFQRFQLGA